jgi:glutaredoxin
MTTIAVTLIGKPGCHLCDDAETLVLEVLSDFSEVTFVKRNLDERPDWALEYLEKIPVILINDTLHSFWRVDPEEFRRDLESTRGLSVEENSE